jgi:conjugal transfer pilus assembly protein TrbC
VLAQTTVDGLDLDAINKAAQVHARNLGQFVDEVLGHQAKANADQADELEDLVATSRAKMQAVAAAKAKANPTGDQVDLDALVADAGRSMAPSAQSASQSADADRFASLSMPPESLKRMIADVSKAGGMVVFRGFSPGGPKPFMAALHEAIGDTTGAMSASIPGCSVPMASRRCPPMLRLRRASTCARARTAPAPRPMTASPAM